MHDLLGYRLSSSLPGAIVDPVSLSDSHSSKCRFRAGHLSQFTSLSLVFARCSFYHVLPFKGNILPLTGRHLPRMFFLWSFHSLRRHKYGSNRR
ncbi:hypothetical protein HMPREF1705_04685 [Acetomicrobium hydrogeniformans ATCC BAA-1850]|uniref:Uncharacterized protein n=1 Tax=Acetomicrobium hydrogeniformans ATCC BAA-1850 TaxID=592015 RepID=A0A0T5XC41_9BACT|nr:hypothetical protein HMPREF1705_04685 [Acetomicrobium hydrogeniformans ATCC BAA-1850]